MAAAPRETSPTSAWKKVFVWKQKNQREKNERGGEREGKRESRRRREGGEGGTLLCFGVIFLPTT